MKYNVTLCIQGRGDRVRGLKIRFSSNFIIRKKWPH